MRTVFGAVMLTFALLCSTAISVLAQDMVPGAVDAATKDRLARSASGTITFNERANTGVTSFATVSRGGDLMPTSKNETVAGKSADFFTEYGVIFGVTDPANELSVSGETTDYINNTHLTYQQVYQGIEVFGGQLKTHFDPDLNLTTVNGVFVPAIKVKTTPELSAEHAGEIAVKTVREQQGSAADDVAMVHSRLLVYRAGLVKGVLGSDHLVYEVEVANPAGTVREFVYVDAHDGEVVEQITGIFHALTRTVAEVTSSNVIWTEGQTDPIPNGWASGSTQQVKDWQNEIDGARETYNLFSSMAGRDSYDNAGATMKTINNALGVPCPNAVWTGNETMYCSNVTGDDTVAHEWGHAYTEHTSDLVYLWQSGALNESYSDIWGEVVDLLNGRGLDAPDTVRPAGNCSSNPQGANFPGSPTTNTIRWLSGEDDPAFNGIPTGSGNAIRDMWNPTCFGDPARVTDTNYWCQETDGGGVHTNSGVPNHAFALLVDGGAYNGQTITSIGLTKTAHIHWYAQSNLLTSASNFSSHADALKAACTALTNVNLNALKTNTATSSPSGEKISAADCQEVADAIAAVEFYTDTVPICGFTPLLDQSPPPLCPNPANLNTFFTEDWEGGSLPGGWNVGTRDVLDPGDFAIPNWAVVNAIPPSPPAGSTFAAFVSNPSKGNCTTNDQTGVLYLESPSIVIPASAAVPRVAFYHSVGTELEFDGGNIKVSVNGGPWELVPSDRFNFNAYNTTLATFQNTNPMAGEPAFSGTDEGSVSGRWGQSQLNLTGIAGPGDTIKVRFEEGQDGCFGILGWYVDNVEAYYCAGEEAPPSLFAPLLHKSVALNPPACVPDPAGDSNNVNDAKLICFGQAVTGNVSQTDLDDVYKIWFNANESQQISLSGTGGDADLFLYPPGTTDVNVDPWAALSANDGNDELIQGTPLVSGYWYIDVYSYAGSTSYSLLVEHLVSGQTDAPSDYQSGLFYPSISAEESASKAKAHK